MKFLEFAQVIPRTQTGTDIKQTKKPTRKEMLEGESHNTQQLALPPPLDLPGGGGVSDQKPVSHSEKKNPVTTPLPRYSEPKHKAELWSKSCRIVGPGKKGFKWGLDSTLG